MVVSLICFIGWTNNEQRQKQPTIWEYKILVRPTEDDLNALGAERWELVSVAAYGDTNAYQLYAYLKRAK